MRKGGLAAVAVVLAAMAIPVSGTRSTFAPDWTFKGSTLSGWQVLGQADWRAVDGELIGTPKSPDGGWLLLDKSFQDVQFGADFRCAAGCKTGVLLRAEKTAGGIKGVYVSLTEADAGSYAVTLDASGHEVSRQRLSAAGGMARFAPTPTPAVASTPSGLPAGGAAAAPPAAGQGRGQAPAGRGAPSAVTAIVPHPSIAIKPDDWNDLDIVIDATLLRPHVNTGLRGAGGSVAVDEAMGQFGPIALYVGGTGEVRFRDVSYKDVNLKRFAKEEISANFRMQRLTPFQYSWAQAAADVNNDGQMDIIIPPFIFLWPGLLDGA